MSILWEKEEEEKEQHQRQRQALYESPCRSEQLIITPTRGKKIIIASIRRKRRAQPVESFSDDITLDNKIKKACSIGGEIPPSIQRLFLELPKNEDKALIADFIIDSFNQQNITPSTKRVYIANLVYLSRNFEHKKSFKEMTKEDIISDYLNSVKRPTALDPDQKWINTYNQRAMVFSKFYKWVSQPDLKPKERQLPPTLKGLRFIQRRGPKTNVKPTDLWTLEDDALFIKYCQDPRLACYHMMSRDTSARPGELLAVRTGEVKIKKAGTKMFAEVEIGRYGKVKKSRIVPLINSLPYFKAWFAQHPMSTDPQATEYATKTSFLKELARD